MKVAVVTNYFPTSVQPWAGHSAYQTLRVLAKRCDLQVFYPEPVYPPKLKPASKGADLDRTWSPPDVKVTYLPYRTLPVVSRGFNGFIIARALIGAVRAFQPDILLNYIVYPTGFSAVLIGRKLGVPVVLTATGSDLNVLGDRLCAMWKRRALRQADVVKTVSQDLANTAIRLGADPRLTQAVLNGCDTEVFHPRDRAAARQELGIGADEEVVVYVGRMDHRKGLVELVEAAAALKEKRPRMRTYLVGNGTDEGMLRQAIAKLGVEERVVLVPPCSTQGVAAWMAASDLVTLPSYNEGCPNVVVEALSSGRPVVATRVGGIPELMDERCGRLIPAMDVAALARALDETLSTAWSAEEISKSRSRSWAEVADETETLLKAVLARR